MNAHWITRARSLALAAVFAAGAAGSAGAQDLSVLVRLGSQSFDKAASLENTLFVGLDAMYPVNSWLELGPSLSIGRGQTTGDHFVSTITYGVVGTGDTTSFFRSTQPQTLLDATFGARVSLPGDRLIRPYALAGVGGYVQLLDPVVMGRDKRQVGVSFNAGVGAMYQFSERAGIALDFRAFVLNDYDRTALDPRAGINTPTARAENTLWAEDFPAAPASKSSVTNYSMSIGFSYVPSFLGGGR
jgi:opacity protein-like surface antigen